MMFDNDNGWTVRNITTDVVNLIQPTTAGFMKNDTTGIIVLYAYDVAESGFLTGFIGKTVTPADINSYNFTQFQVSDVGGTQAKVVMGKNGVGIIVVESDPVVVDGLDYQYNYKYTLDYGSTWLPESNWEVINQTDVAPFIGYTAGEAGSEVTITEASILGDCDVMLDENNNAHIFGLLRGSDGTNIYKESTTGQPIDGYYHLKINFTGNGYAVEEGKKADFMAYRVGWDEEEIDGETFNCKYVNGLRIFSGSAVSSDGKEILYASWSDRPVGGNIRAITPKPGVTIADSREHFISDGFFTYSEDGGMTWIVDPVTRIAANVTNSSKITTPHHEAAWTVPKQGRYDSVTKTLEVFAGYQAPDWDILNPPSTPDLPEYFQQNFHVVRITASSVQGDIQSEDVAMGKDFDLAQNYPNPFNPTTAINFNLQNAGDVNLSVYNAQGEVVSNLISARMSEGNHTANFNAGSLNSGVYFYKLSYGGQSMVKKMVLTK